MTARPPNNIVIIGGGQAAAQLITSLRTLGYDRPITLVGEEVDVPYQRPPLSKAYLAGEVQREKLYVRSPNYYGEHGVEFVSGLRATSIDRASHRITLADGRALPYGRLALTVGARPRPLSCPGAELAGVHLLRTISDVDSIRPAVLASDDVAIVGGGFIGLEVAAVLRKLGKRVTVLEMQERLMPRVVSPSLSAFYSAQHIAHGVEVLTGTQVARLRGANAQVTHIECTDGRLVAAQTVIVGIGVLANIELARDTGLHCDNGIAVDELARTSDPDIVAAGDCASHPSQLFARRVRLESVQNAMDQAKSAAASLLGLEQPNNQVPWFWSDQYDLKLQMTGLSQGYDRELVRGDMASKAFSLFYFQGERLLAVDSVNKPGDHLTARKLLARGARVEPSAVSDPQFDLKSVLP